MQGDDGSFPVHGSLGLRCSQVPPSPRSPAASRHLEALVSSIYSGTGSLLPSISRLPLCPEPTERFPRGEAIPPALSRPPGEPGSAARRTCPAERGAGRGCGPGAPSASGADPGLPSSLPPAASRLPAPRIVLRSTNAQSEMLGGKHWEEEMEK